MDNEYNQQSSSDVSGAAEQKDRAFFRDIHLSVVIPDDAAVQNAEDEHFYYVFHVADHNGSSSIPYVILGAYNFSHPEKFFPSFLNFMMKSYPDIRVVESETTVFLGGKQMTRVIYEYNVSGYTCRDTRIAWPSDGLVYMFGSKEIPQINYYVGNLLDKVAVSAERI